METLKAVQPWKKPKIEIKQARQSCEKVNTWVKTHVRIEANGGVEPVPIILVAKSSWYN